MKCFLIIMTQQIPISPTHPPHVNVVAWICSQMKLEIPTIYRWSMCAWGGGGDGGMGVWGRGEGHCMFCFCSNCLNSSSGVGVGEWVCRGRRGAVCFDIWDGHFENIPSQLLLINPPNTFFFTFIIVTVGPFLSHLQWNVAPFQLSSEAL